MPTDNQKILLGERIEEMLKGEQRLELEPKDEKVEELALHFYKEIIKKHSYDAKRKGTKWQTVDLDSVKNKDVKDIETNNRSHKPSNFVSESWNEIVRVMNTQKAVTTTMKNIIHQTIKIRQCSTPNQK
ncbi:MAG: hypothetical protein J7L95_03020, partial [Prolixibacteraceae bacterium]|nr:hypothetical protein [Prolixibacteraceae bacterium]